MVLLATFILFVVYTRICLSFLIRSENGFIPFALWVNGSMILWLSSFYYYLLNVS
jgi:hypothetical protein